jgi:hypothetical protein
MNPKDIPYMDFHQSSTNLNDPWDNKYRMALDNDYDGEVDIPNGGTLRMSVAVWSAGKDGDENTMDDNVKTWR